MQGGLGDDLVELIETDAAVPVGVKQLPPSEKYAHQWITFIIALGLNKKWGKNTSRPEVDRSLKDKLRISMCICLGI